MPVLHISHEDQLQFKLFENLQNTAVAISLYSYRTVSPFSVMSARNTFP